ncbi:hypothetical protein EV356DRAFT_440975 [Viridothelium virens]|uniref:ferric-chelate reductase (NADPH) n=1 Tax=Viridothelium virens TaxID=1048519 RepID=A0A6A6HJ78_VIRVR|nr:hypothetical protein EV356DRAFT_440975 [Viridothelium virens]
MSTATLTIMTFAVPPYYRARRGFGSPPLAVRTGLVSAALIPLLIALAGKVNLISLVTGYGHEKLNVMHRYVAWMMFILSTVHTIPFFWQEGHEGSSYIKAKFYAAGAFEYTGVPPYALAFFLVSLSLPPVRCAAYETFVISHITAAIVLFGLCFWHFGNEGDSWNYLWATMALWLIQILGRVFWKMSTLRLSEDWFEGYPTTIRRLPGNVFKLQVTVPSHWTWHAGQHVFIKFLRLNIFESHPFTIASAPRTGSSLAQEKRSEPASVMTFLVQARTGSTRKLFVMSESVSDLQLSTVIDDPYGTVDRRYDRCAEEVVLVAGGNEITACIPRLHLLAQAMLYDECVTQHVRLAWMIKSSEQVDWVVEDLRQVLTAITPDKVTADIFVTSEQPNSKKLNAQSKWQELELRGDSQTRSTSSSQALKEYEGVTMHFGGRPNLSKLIPSFIGRSRTAVIGCGPESLKISLSNAIAALQRRVLVGQAQAISLHTEAFDW